ncbi:MULTISPECIES: DUF6518 family protein [unclassified Streptomyces]|uniref:DUF6518 family protein n=1 Tax=unclassified Streptomyces TaxID=2593676 RepID=UPI002E2F97C4|nr:MULTISPECIES: DUF6518 family protein [unclassified Streptomyces]
MPTPPTSRTHKRIPALSAPAAGLAAGLVLGLLTNLAQGWLPGSFNQIPNSGAVWSAAAFAAGVILAHRATPVLAAGTGLLTELGLVIGYYGYAACGRDGIGALTMPLLWAAAACVAGPLFGVAGFLSRNGSSAARRIAGTAALAGVFGGEGFYYARVLHHSTEATACILVLVVLSLLLPRTLRDRTLTLAAAVGLSLLSFVVVGAAGTAISSAPAFDPAVVPDRESVLRVDAAVQQTEMFSAETQLFRGSPTLPGDMLPGTSAGGGLHSRNADRA